MNHRGKFSIRKNGAVPFATRFEQTVYGKKNQNF